VLKGKKRSWVLAGIVFLVSLAAASSVAAGGIGPRLGLTGDPDQVHVGLHVHAGDLAPNLAFVPSFDVGIGDETVLFSVNFDFKYVFATRTRWRPYAGAGPALHVLNRDNADDNTEVGLGLIGGLQTPTRSGAFFGEMRLGLVDSPDFKFTVGWAFR
jgi:hypothetical protein